MPRESHNNLKIINPYRGHEMKADGGEVSTVGIDEASEASV
jgi:hypothetical protein